MRSHNLGIDKMKEDDSDWLIVLSAAMRFGEPGGLDFIAELEKAPGDLVIEPSYIFGWHLIAFSRQVIEKVGRWDENFTPYGFDDLDYSWRIQKTFDITAPLWRKVSVDVSDAGMAHSIHIGKVESDVNRLREYFKEK